MRAGYLRQAHSGIFHLLPLGLRVQNKIEGLIDKHMSALGASKVSLSSLSSEELWAKSGRLDKGRSSELLRLEDRKGAKYLLSPTHEEEITTIIADAVHSYKELPLRLYQVTRKYRDEPRPRHGLLRSREFLMKDLYTFDVTEDAAKQTYEQVRRAYAAFLSELKMPYLTAAASSGNMGGNMSHEYHLASSSGEDTIIKCEDCEHAINEEIYVSRLDHDAEPVSTPVTMEVYVSKDRRKLCHLHYPEGSGEPNIYTLKEVWPEVDPAVQGEDAIAAFRAHANKPGRERVHVIDPRLLRTEDPAATGDEMLITTILRPPRVLMTKARSGDACPSCKTGRLQLHQAVEIGHTFHLGTRYSAPLSASVLDASNRTVPIQMGCHGIGVSRLIGAAASLLADRAGLNWPLAISPFQVLIVPGGATDDEQVGHVYDDLLSSLDDAAIDDRDRPLGWKLKDADLVGYPIIVVMGRRWKDERVVEVQCRRLGVREEVPCDALGEKVRALRSRL